MLNFMTIPMWVLLGFAGWTLTVLIGTVGIYRWSRIATGRSGFGEGRAPEQQGREWYRRAIRAHTNCVESLPVYGAIVLCAYAVQASSDFLNLLAVTILAARICQTSVHIAVPQTGAVAAMRFAFFYLQVLCMVSMGIIVAATAAG